MAAAPACAGEGGVASHVPGARPCDVRLFEGWTRWEPLPLDGRAADVCSPTNRSPLDEPDGLLFEALEDWALLSALEACSGSVDGLVALYRLLSQCQD